MGKYDYYMEKKSQVESGEKISGEYETGGKRRCASFFGRTQEKEKKQRRPPSGEELGSEKA